MQPPPGEHNGVGDDRMGSISHWWRDQRAHPGGQSRAIRLTLTPDMASNKVPPMAA